MTSSRLLDFDPDSPPPVPAGLPLALLRRGPSDGERVPFSALTWRVTGYLFSGRFTNDIDTGRVLPVFEWRGKTDA